MSVLKNNGDLSEKIKIALDKAIKKLIEEEKARDGYLVIANKNGEIVKVPAKDL